ncbi:hypothetical protein [Lactococcus sp.]|uniref:hypothetical protein n=1 Tax=Lactococcus sp. TaxID=44273 RepID=UPI002FC996DB
MIKQYKKEGSYITFLPTGKEYPLVGFSEGYGIVENDSKYLDYGFVLRKNLRNQEYYQLLINNSDNLKVVINAYDLYYEAVYKGERFRADISTYPQVTLFAGTNDYGAAAKTNIEGFELEVGCWVKDVDISKLEIIPVKEPIDLTRFLPSSNN